MPDTIARRTRVVRRAAARAYYRLRARPPLLTRRRPPQPPDFVGIGAQRSGTSWWHALIESHPAVHQLGWPFKELHYFDRFAHAPFGDDDIAQYHELFRRPHGRVAGEWTPRYMFDEQTPALLRRAAPDARLLVLVRDPVERFRSGVAHALARGVPERDARDDAFRRGLYFAQLRNVLASFPREQLLVLQFERCIRAPAEMLAVSTAFLGLEPFRPEGLAKPLNTGAPGGIELDAAERARLIEAYAGDVAALTGEFSGIDLELWADYA